MEKIDWAAYDTAYGDATSVPKMLRDLASSDHAKCMKAAHELWCGLCHQHAYVSSAALPSHPVLVKVLRYANRELKVEILDILEGFSLCSQSDFPNRPTTDDSWRQSLRAEMIKDRKIFQSLVQSDDEEVAQFAGEIVKYLDEKPLLDS